MGRTVGIIGKAKPWVLAGAIVACAAAAFALGWVDALLDVAQWEGLRRAVEVDPLFAVAAYVACTVAGCAALALPGAAFALAAGALFGPVAGVLWCSVATTIGAVAAFLLGRYFLKDAVKPRIMAHERLRKLLFDEKGRNAVLLLLVTRLVPLFPYNLQNFAYGVTDMRLATYAACSFAFMLPGTAAYVLVGAGTVDEGARAACFAAAAVLLVALCGAAYALKRRQLAAGGAGAAASEQGGAGRCEGGAS